MKITAAASLSESSSSGTAAAPNGKRPAKRTGQQKRAAASQLIEITAPNILAYLRDHQKQHLFGQKRRKVPAEGSTWKEDWQKTGGALRKMGRLYQSGELITGDCLITVRASTGKLLSPAHQKMVLNAAARIMNQAMWDCRLLDLFRAGSGVPKSYLAKLDFNQVGVLASMSCLVIALRPKRQITPGADGQVMLYVIEEMIRDGIPADIALAFFGIACGELLLQQARDGNSDTFIALGSKLARLEPAKRPLAYWILRAWLPLRLWQCAADGRKAHDRFCRAWQLLGRTPPNWLKFVNAWNNLRTRPLRGWAKQQALVNSISCTAKD